MVYDKETRLLSLRNTSDPEVELPAFDSCPYCHRPLRATSAFPPNVSEDGPSFVNPDYFQKLQYQYSRDHSARSSAPATPRWRIGPLDGLPPIPGTPRQRVTVEDDPDEVNAVPPIHSHISSKAFSQGYLANFFTIQGELGRGGKGVVLLVRHKLAGHALGQYACKRVPVGDDHRWLEKVLTEVQLLQGLSHQNIVAYRHAWLEDYQLSTFAPSVPCLFILQQYCNTGDLHAFVLGTRQPEPSSEQRKDRARRRSKGQLDEMLDPFPRQALPLEEIISFVRDITSGLHYLHSNNLVHRDLKPKNCLLHRDKQRLRVLVSDFGETQVAGDVRMASGATGTLSYCAPEVLVQDPATGTFGQFTTNSDVFSLGMIVYFVCFGKVPYSCADEINDENEDIEQLREEIASWPGVDDRRERADLPEKLYKFLKMLLSRDPNQRPSTEDILRAVNEPEIQTSQYTTAAAADGHERHTSPRRQWVEESNRSPSQSMQVGELRTPLLTRTESGLVLRKPPRVDDQFEEYQPRHPRLLLAPQQKAGSLLRFKVLLAFSNPTVLVPLRLLVFAAKMWSLYTACYPFSPDPWVSMILMILASLDLVGVTRNVGELLSFAGLHYLFIAMAKYRQIICRHQYLAE